jgi:cytochrome P450
VQYTLANTLLQLLQSPDDWRRLVSSEEIANAAIEECLRFAPPGNYMIRRASSDLEFGGQHIKAGSRIYLITGAANRDPACFDDPQRFMLDRKVNPHLSFGGGAHFCLGAPLARMEMKAALKALVQTLPRLELAEPFSSLKWQRALILRGVDRVPARIAREEDKVAA